MFARLRLGLIPVPGRTGEDKIVAQFSDALASVVGVPVEVHRSVDYRVLTSALDQGLVDVAWLPPLAAARTVRTGIAVPAAIAVRSGTTSYMSGLFALASGPVRSLEDLKNLRAAWVDRESASGYVVIRAALRDYGISLTSAFSDELFLRSHAEVARAVKDGEVDVGATCFNFESGSTRISRAGYEEAGLTHAEVRLLGYAGPIPSDIFAVHKRISPGLLATLQGALVDARPAQVHSLAKQWMHSDAFARPTSEHTQMLDSLFSMVKSPLSVPPARP